MGLNTNFVGNLSIVVLLAAIIGAPFGVYGQNIDTLLPANASQSTYNLLEQEDYFVMNPDRGEEYVFFNYVYTFPENNGVVVFTLNGKDFFAIENVEANTMEGEFVGQYYRLRLENGPQAREGRAFMTNRNPGVAEKEGIIGFSFSYESGAFVADSILSSNSGNSNTDLVGITRRILPQEYKDLKRRGLTDVFQSSERFLPSGITKVYPNPTAGFSQVIFQSDRTEVIDVIVFDGAGRVVRNRRRLDALAGENNFQLDLSGLSEGVYKIVIQQGRNQYQTFVAKRLNPR